MKLSLALLTALFLFVGSVEAQDGSQDPIQTPECPQIAWSCAEVTDLDKGKVGVGHRQQLKQSGLPATDAAGNPQRYIIACGLNTDKGFLATTGNNALDREYCLSSSTFNTYRYLQQTYGYELTTQGFTNPFTSNNGSIDKTVLPSNEGESRTHMCVIGWKQPVVTTGSGEDTSTNTASRDTYGLEYTTFTFARGAAQCVTVYADPYGRTYNKDLKPVPGARVSIFDFDSKSLMNLFGLINPFETGIDGIFNFNIPPGRSYLQTQLPNVLDVHPNYSLAYTDPYKYGDVIVETLGNAEQRDIAVSGGGTPQLKLTGYSHVKTGNQILLQGSASWPLTIVDVIQGNTSLMQQQATKFGNFEFKIDPRKIDPAQQLTVKLTEVDLTSNPKSPAANPATDSIRIDPIPAYLEGYAYDTAGNLMPFASVRVRLQVNNALYYQTRADKDAFYSVAPRNLPIMPFYLEIVPANALPGSVVPGNTGTGGTDAGGTGTGAGGGVDGNTETGTSGSTGTGDTTGTGGTTGMTSTGGYAITIPTYARQNKEYHSVNSVNIMAGTKNGIQVDPRAVADSTTAVFGNQGGDVTTTQAEKAAQEALAKEAQSKRYLQALLYAFGLVFIGTLAVVLIRKRAHQHGSDAGTYTRETNEE